MFQAFLAENIGFFHKILSNVRLPDVIMRVRIFCPTTKVDGTLSSTAICPAVCVSFSLSHASSSNGAF